MTDRILSLVRENDRLQRLVDECARDQKALRELRERHRECARQKARLRWKLKKAREPQPVVRRPSTANLELSRADIDRILGMPPRD